MTIVVTALGTNTNKAATTCDFTYAQGLVASAGDWICVCSASDLAYSVLPLFFDSSASKAYDFSVIASVTNAGNVLVSVMLFHLPVATATGDYVRITGASNQASALSVYKVTGINYSASVPSNATNSSYATIYSAAPRRGSLYYNCKASTLTTADAFLRKVGSPTGTAYCRIRRISDDSIIGTLGSIDVATLTTTLTWYTFNSASAAISTDEPHVLCIEYSGGDASNHVGLGYGGTNPSYQSAPYVHNGTAWLAAPGTQYYNFRNLTGLSIYDPFDKSATATGSSDAPSSGATGTLSQADELIVGVVGIEGPNGDTDGTWTTGSGNVSGNEQILGTTGSTDISNITISTAAEVVAATTAQTAAKTGMTSRDWAALVVSIRALVGTQYNQSASGSLTVSGAVSFQITKAVAGSATAAGALVRQSAKLLSGGVTAAGSLMKSAAKSVAGSITTSGLLAATKVVMLALSGTILAAGAVSQQTNKLLTGTSTASGALAKSVGRLLAGSLTLAGALIKQASRAAAGAIIAAGSLVRQAVKVTSGSVLPAGLVSRQINKMLSGLVYSGGSLVRQVATSVSGSITASGVVTYVRVILLSLSGSIAASGALLRTIGKNASGSIAASGALQWSRTVVLLLSGSIVASGSLIRATTRRLAGSIAASGALASTKAYLISLAGSIAASGNVTRSISKSLAGAITAVGSLARNTGQAIMRRTMYLRSGSRGVPHE